MRAPVPVYSYWLLSFRQSARKGFANVFIGMLSVFPYPTLLCGNGRSQAKFSAFGDQVMAVGMEILPM